jgi:carbonic anhydrase
MLKNPLFITRWLVFLPLALTQPLAPVPRAHAKLVVVPVGNSPAETASSEDDKPAADGKAKHKAKPHKASNRALAKSDAILMAIAGKKASMRPGEKHGAPAHAAHKPPHLPGAASPPRQSPINIDTAHVAPAAAPSPLFADLRANTTLSLVNTYDPASGIDPEWATLKANVPMGAAHIHVGGGTYNLLQFHFHTPSEHSIDGRRAAMEVHFVFLRQDATACERAMSPSAPDPLLVIGAMIEQGAPHPELGKILDRLDLPTSKAAPALTIASFDLGAVLGSLEDNWRYPGSLTAPASFAPGCQEPEGDVVHQLKTDDFPKNVRWLLLRHPIYLSGAQITNFRKLFPEGNSREVMPLQGRKVVSYR